jgi:hypothetical protein
MIRIGILALVALSSPALAGCPDCILQREQMPPPPEVDLGAFEPTPRRTYQPTYQEPIPEPRRQMNSYELDNAIRQIPGWNKQFPNYGR